MKQLLLMMIVLVSSTTNSRGQFEAEVSFGFNAAQIDGDRYSGYTKLGLFGGLGVNYKVNPQWYLMTGIAYNEVGSQKELQIGSSNPEEQQKIQLSYVSIPLFAKVNFGSRKDDYSKFQLSGGLQIGYLMKSKIQDRTDEFILEFFNNWDLAGSLGVSYRMNPSWSIGVKGYESFTLLFNNNKTQQINSNSLRNRHLSFALYRKL